MSHNIQTSCVHDDVYLNNKMKNTTTIKKSHKPGSNPSFTKIDKRNTHANICTNIHIEIFCEKNFEILHAISFRRIEYLLKAKYYKKPYIFTTNKYLFVLK